MQCNATADQIFMPWLCTYFIFVFLFKQVIRNMFPKFDFSSVFYFHLLNITTLNKLLEIALHEKPTEIRVISW